MSPTSSIATATPAAKRGPGAPPGNRNAVTHGFYARTFKKIDLSGLDGLDASGLKDEIAMLRVLIRRVLEIGQEVQDLPAAVDLLRALSMATTSLTRLIKTQHLIAAGTDEVSTAIHQALLEIAEQLELSLDGQADKTGRSG